MKKKIITTVKQFKLLFLTLDISFLMVLAQNPSSRLLLISVISFVLVLAQNPSGTLLLISVISFVLVLTQNPSGTLRYTMRSLTPEATSFFIISPNNGLITVAQPLSYDKTDPKRPFYQVWMTSNYLLHLSPLFDNYNLLWN